MLTKLVHHQVQVLFVRLSSCLPYLSDDYIFVLDVEHDGFFNYSEVFQVGFAGLEVRDPSMFGVVDGLFDLLLEFVLAIRREINPGLREEHDVVGDVVKRALEVVLCEDFLEKDDNWPEIFKFAEGSNKGIVETFLSVGKRLACGVTTLVIENGLERGRVRVRTEWHGRVQVREWLDLVDLF